MGQEESVKDPVCGMVKSVSQMQAKSVYKGKTYYFCTLMDKETFDANPNHWVPRENNNV